MGKQLSIDTENYCVVGKKMNEQEGIGKDMRAYNHFVIKEQCMDYIFNFVHSCEECMENSAKLGSA